MPFDEDLAQDQRCPGSNGVVKTRSIIRGGANPQKPWLRQDRHHCQANSDAPYIGERNHRGNEYCSGPVMHTMDDIFSHKRLMRS